MSEPTYHLPERGTGTAWFGLAGPQVALLGGGAVAVVVALSTGGSALAVVAAVVVAGCCGLAAVVPVAGQPLYQLLPAAVGWQRRRIGGADRWTQPIVSATTHGAAAGSPARGMPPPLAGLEVRAVTRPGWAGADRTLAPCGLVYDRRAGTVTAVLDVRSNGFSLLDAGGQHHHIGAWARVLSQFGREAPVTRLGWTLRSAPAALSDHVAWLDTRPHQATGRPGTSTDGEQAAADTYRGLVTDSAATVAHHDLRLWLTIDTRRLRRTAITSADAALAAVQALAERCRTAGLTAGDPLSPLELAETLRVHADPTARPGMTAVRRGLAGLAGLEGFDPALIAPLAMRNRWNGVQIDGAWHRTFWIATWPALGLRPGWLDPLLHDTTHVRTLSVIMEPVGARQSRKRINTEAVSLDTQIQLRDRHSFRIPTHLARAQDGVDRRETELAAGFPEYAYLGLVDLTADSLDELDDATANVADLAARCGIADLRPLHGRHDAGWAATLPFGRAPGRALVGGG